MFLKNNRLYIFIFIALLPIMLFRDFTPDNELRYLSIADEALRNGTWFMFTNHGIPYADKPPLYIWIIMVSKLIFGTYPMWFLALFSLIPAFLIARTFDKWLAEAIPPSSREAGARMLLSCGLFMGCSIFLRMDMLMCLFIVLSLRTFYQLLLKQGNTRKLQWLFPLYVFLAIFSKGPMGFLIPLFVTVVYLLLTHRIKTIGRYWGWRTWSVLLAGCILWFGLAYLEGGGAYLNNMLVHQTVGRAVHSFHHEGPFYWYFKSMWYTFLPWSILLIGTLIAVLLRRDVHTELEKLLLTSLIVPFALCCCISSKIDIYLLPIYPFWVYFTALYIFRNGWERWTTIGIALPALVFVFAEPCTVYLNLTYRFGFLNVPFFHIAGTVLSVTGIWTLVSLYKRSQKEQAVKVFTNGLFIALFIGGWGVPTMNDTLGYATMCEEALKAGQAYHLNQFATYDINRPENMDVFLHKAVKQPSLEDLQQKKLQKTVLMVSADSLPYIERITQTKASWQTNRHGIILLK